MNKSKFLISGVVFLVYYVSLTASLVCYFCVATSPSQPCVTDWLGMANSSTRHYYAKNCSSFGSRYNRCMILSMEQEGYIVYYQRDCHNGIYFPDPDFTTDVFLGLPPNNITTCDDRLEKHICYTPCDTDFCNGPELLPEKNCTDLESD